MMQMNGTSHTSASVIPSPARRIGVRPIRGLILLPVKEAMGVCYVREWVEFNTQIQAEQTNEHTPSNDSSPNVRDAS
jgi:hypothetical protein